MTKRRNTEIVIFPVGPLVFRLELAKRARLDHKGSSVSVIVRKGEGIGQMPEGIMARPCTPWRSLLAYRGKSGVVPFCHYAWFGSFSRMLALAYLVGTRPVQIYRDSTEPVKENPLLFFVRQFITLLISGLAYASLRFVRKALPFLSNFLEGNRPLRRANRVWLVIPVYPDLSHHFIFQQISALSRLFPSEMVAVFKGEDRYRANYMASLDLGMKFLPAAKELCLAVLKNFCLLSLRYPRRLLRVCLELEQSARDEGQNLWSLRAFLSPFNPLYGVALYGLSRGCVPRSIHTYGMTFPTNYGLFFSLLFDIPHTATYFIDIPKGIPFQLFRLKSEKLQKVIVHTRQCIPELKDLSGIPTAKMAVIPFGTMPAEQVKSDPENAVSELLAVGRLIPKKGFNVLIEACNILRSKGQNFECLIVGSGPEYSRLVEYVRGANLEESVHFLGDKRYDEYLSLLVPNRILVQPSVVAKDGDHDGVPTVVLEAMARGLIVIGTNVGGIPEVVVDGRNGFLVPPNDPDALADCIERITFVPDMRHRIGKEARSTIAQHYNVQNLAKKMAQECGFLEQRD
jgi:glycosyltransferase involved in cell wall biosynthesis